MIAQTEPAVLSAELATYAAGGYDDFLRGCGIMMGNSILRALEAIATGITLCKSSAAEAADRARIAELERRITYLHSLAKNGRESHGADGDYACLVDHLTPDPEPYL